MSLYNLIPVKKWRDKLKAKKIRNKDLLSYIESLRLSLELMQYVKKDAINLVLRDGFGDSILICGFARELAKQHDAKLFFMVKPSQEILMKMYGFEDYIVLNSLSKKKLSKGDYINTSAHPKKGQVYFPHGRYHKETELYEKECPCFCVFIKELFVLPQEAAWQPPANYPQIGEELKEKLAKIGPLDKIILFSPESSGSSVRNFKYWQKLADILQEKGYKIINNIIKEEHSIKGAENWVKAPVEEMMALGASCKAVVSLRSGFVDMVAISGKGRLFIFSSTLTRREAIFFNIGAMFDRKEGVYEFESEKSIGLKSLAEEIISGK